LPANPQQARSNGIMIKSALVRALTTALLIFNRNVRVVGLEERDSA
jgi:hypothetical protein